MSDGSGAGFGFGAAISLFVVMIGGGAMYGCPQYNVYSSRMNGEAELAHAEFSKQVQVREAEGKLAAATKLADVEVARAKGVAQANQIIGDSLKGNEDYLRYLWINNLEGKNPTVIYVPTEAGLPILEAGRRPPIMAMPKVKK
jgi:regulator of protease activity HflC (stomatin/prohibitin superfamily)